MKKLRFLRSRSRNTVTLLLVCLLAVLLLAGNLLLPFALRRASVYVDMTPERLYTLSAAMKEEIGQLEEGTEVEILFLSPEDRLLEHSLLRYVYIMSRKLEKESKCVSVRTVDLMRDPTAADEFKTAKGSTLSSSDVIVHSAGRYKILSADSFFGSENNELISFNGEYRLATAILSVTTYAEGPYAYFAVGHGEKYYIDGEKEADRTEGYDEDLSAFAGLLRDTGLRVGKVDLDKEEIPEDCVLLILCGPTEDYTVTDIRDHSAPSVLKKLDKYLAGKKSLMYFRESFGADGKTPAAPLTDLEDYLSEWGIAFTPTHVTSPDESLADVDGVQSGDRLIAVYPDSDIDAPAYAMIKDVASLLTPPKVIISNASSMKNTFVTTPIYLSENTSRSVCPVFYAGPSSKAHDADGFTVEPDGDRHILAMMGMEATLTAGEHRYSYVFAAGSTEMISDAYLADHAFGNGDVMAAVLRSISRTDVFASSAVGGFDPNSVVYGGKWFDETHLSASGKNLVFHSQTSWDEYDPLTTGSTVFLVIVVFIVPVVVLPALAIVVLRRRKNK